MIFHLLEIIGEKKFNNKIFIMKNEKKSGAQIGMGYCPIVLQKERKLYCNTVIVLQRKRLEENGNCIAIQEIVLQ